jgi:methionyl aminopeptidase
VAQPPIYNSDERERLRAASRFNAQLMDFIRPQIVAGITTKEIDTLVHDYTRDHGHTPACLGYKGFPASSCISVNEVVCHGIPDDRVLVEGDIANVDLTTIVDGWFGDQSEMFMIAPVSDDAKRLLQTTLEALWIGINAIKPFGHVRDIGREIYAFAYQRGFGVVREYQGHGIGRSFHQEPSVPHFWFRGQRVGNQVIKPGMCFTIEPMLNLGGCKTKLDPVDNWTVRTKDRKLSAQFEHTVLMTEECAEVLTLTKDGPQEGHRF